MRIKIIKNQPMFDDCSDISKYIGQEFNVTTIDGDGVFVVLYGEEMQIYNGEFEIIEY